MAKSIDYEEFVDIFAGELVKKIRSSDTKMAELFDEMSDITNEAINRELQSMSNEKIAEIVTKATEDAQTEVKEIKQKLFCDSDIFFTQRVLDDVIKIGGRHYMAIPKKYNSLQETQAREMLPTQYRHL